MRKNFERIFIVLISFCLAFSGCTGAQSAAPTSTATLPPTVTPKPAAIPIPTITPIPLPSLSLVPGDFYFSVDGRPTFILSRNPTGKTQADFDTVLDWAHQGGSKIIRLHLTHGWWGDPWINKDWSVNEKWALDWDRFFDQAQAKGIYVIPVFGVWADWNNGAPDWGSALWQYNPLNSANGGPLDSPVELFESGSDTQIHWMKWVKTLVERWQGRKNIAAWEIFSEINIASGAPGHIDAKGGVDEASGVDFTNKAMAVIHAADSQHRLVTLSLAGVYSPSDKWAEYYKLDSLDFIEIHPYSDKLDRELISEVRQYQAKYQKPVMIGESGLWSLTHNANAHIGIEHAIWAGLVSGAMNGRSLWDNDGYAIFPINNRADAIAFMQAYATAELPVVNFTNGVDFSDFQPLTSTSSSDVWGAAVGNESTILGWYRDAACEPPDWTVQTIPAGQTVTITIPGAAANWQVDFYDTSTGKTILSSTSVTRQGSIVSVTLPEFQDDIAFKMTAGEETSVITSEVVGNTNAIAGTWSGAISNNAGTFSTSIELSIQPDCEAGKLCGTYTAPQLPCSGDLFLNEITAADFIFIEQNISGTASCISGGYENLQLLEDGTLSYMYSSQSTGDSSTGILHRP